jgi:hypothetical protein
MDYSTGIEVFFSERVFGSICNDNNMMGPSEGPKTFGAAYWQFSST